AAGKNADRLIDIVSGEEERAKDFPLLGVRELGRGGAHVLDKRPPGVQGLVLLRVIAELQPVTWDYLSGVRLFHAGEQPQQGGLARAVEAKHHDPAAPVDG